MIPKSVPGKLRDQPMVLVCVAVPVGKDQVRINLPSSALRKSPLPLRRCRAEIRPDTPSRTIFFSLPAVNRSAAFRASLPRLPCRTENNPVKLQIGISSVSDMQKRSAAPNLDVVGMRTKAENRERSPASLLARLSFIMQQLASADWPFFHTHHGASPDASNSSRICLSLKVSMHCQNPS